MKLSYNDSQHAYWLDGKRCKSVTTVAKVLDDTFALEQWRKRQVAIGMAVTPSLVERAAAHYDDKGQLNRIAEEAMSAAKSHEASARGTAAHRITERLDLEQTIIDTPLARAVQRGWKRALDSAGLEILPEYIERIIVYPDLGICGRFDRLAWQKRSKRLMVVDLKTGSSAIKYPHSTAVQLAMYANAPLMAGPIEGERGSTEEFAPLPDVDKRWGLVVHMPDDETVQVHKLDIGAGWTTARSLIFPTLKWQARRDLVKPLAEVGVTDVDAPATPERVSWIKGRIQLIGMIGDNARQLVALRWPNDVTTKGPWTDVDVDALDEMLRSVERDVSAPFPEQDPANNPKEGHTNG